MSETNSSMDGKSGEQKPRRTPRRMKAAIRCRSENDAYHHQALQAYSNLVMTTDLKTACRAVSRKPCARSIVQRRCGLMSSYFDHLFQTAYVCMCCSQWWVKCGIRIFIVRYC